MQSRKCREVCRKFDKPVLIMEPVKGGHLVNLPDSAKKVLDDLHGGSYASYAIRFAAGFPGVMMALSGMSDLDQLRNKLSFMQDFKPMDETERRNRKGAGNLSFDESDSVYRVPLLHGGLPEAHLHSRSVCAFEREADLPRLKRGLLLRRGAHLRRRQSVRLPRRRQMKTDLSAASSGAHAPEGRRKGIRKEISVCPELCFSGHIHSLKQFGFQKRLAQQQSEHDAHHELTAGNARHCARQRAPENRRTRLPDIAEIHDRSRDQSVR